MAISIDGVAQSGRQRVLAVPFAMQAGFAAMAGDVLGKAKFWRPQLVAAGYPMGGIPVFQAKTLPIASSSGAYAGIPINFTMNAAAKKITEIQATLGLGGFTAQAKGKVIVQIQKLSPGAAPVVLFREEFSAATETPERIRISRKVDIQIDEAFSYNVDVELVTPSISGGSTYAALEDLKFLTVE